MVELTAFDALALAIFVYIAYHYVSRLFRTPIQTTTAAATIRQSSQPPLKSIMSAPRDDLDPPQYDPFTTEQLKLYDGSDPQRPIYVAIKGKLPARC
jgi:membrane-associated progesterone receptor component